MAVAVGPHVMKYSSVEIDEVEYANQVTTALLTPDTPTQQLRTLDPTGTLSDVDSPVWTFQLAGPQGGTLAAALRAAAGTAIDVVFQPKVGATQEVATFSAIAIAPPFGGAQGAYRTFDLTMVVVGAPVFSTSGA